MNIHNHDKRSQVLLVNGNADIADLTIEIETPERHHDQSDLQNKSNGDVIQSKHLSQANDLETKNNDDVISRRDLSQCWRNDLELKRNDDVIPRGQLSQRWQNNTAAKNDVIYVGDLSQRDATGDSVSQRLLDEQPSTLGDSHEAARVKKSPNVSLLTRLARKKLKRKKLYYTMGCEMERCAAGGSCSSATSVCAASEDYNYEYIACERCGGYKAITMTRESYGGSCHHSCLKGAIMATLGVMNSLHNLCKMIVSNDLGRMNRGTRRTFFLTVILVLCLFLMYKLHNCSSGTGSIMLPKDTYIVSKDATVYRYDRFMPLIFIGGVPRSGTTLMRAMLDAHPAVRCGQETRIIPRILQMRQHWIRSQKESLRLEEAGVNSEVINAAIAAFCLEVIARHGEPAERLCNKDPLTLKSADYLSEIFPFAKFIFMVRDGRATVHSIISRKVTITGFDLESYRQCLKKWNEAISIMYQKCLRVGPARCMVVYYEQLVLHPEKWLRRILEFFDLSWNSSVLHHEEMINKPGGVFLSKVERSSDQVIKPVNLEALTKWVGQIPEDVLRDMGEIAPMLSRLGYDPTANPPQYGQPDPLVSDNTRRIQENRDAWEEKAMNLLLDSKMPEPSTEPGEGAPDAGGTFQP